MTSFTAAKVAEQLRAHGIVVVKCTEGDDVEDGAVVLSDRLHVQIDSLGGRSMNLVLENEGGTTFKFFPERRSFAGLLADLQQLAATQPAVMLIGQRGIADCRCPACDRPVVGVEPVANVKPAGVTACQHCNTAVRVVDSPAGELSQWYFEAGVLAS